MYSDIGTMALTMVGSPIRSPPDHSLLAAPRGFSQLTTTFFAFLVPRHPPLALIHLTILSSCIPLKPFKKGDKYRKTGMDFAVLSHSLISSARHSADI